MSTIVSPSCTNHCGGVHRVWWLFWGFGATAGEKTSIDEAADAIRDEVAVGGVMVRDSEDSCSDFSEKVLWVPDLFRHLPVESLASVNVSFVK